MQAYKEINSATSFKEVCTYWPRPGCSSRMLNLYSFEKIWYAVRTFFFACNPESKRLIWEGVSLKLSARSCDLPSQPLIWPSLPSFSFCHCEILTVLLSTTPRGPSCRWLRNREQIKDNEGVENTMYFYQNKIYIHMQQLLLCFSSYICCCDAALSLCPSSSCFSCSFCSSFYTGWRNRRWPADPLLHPPLRRSSRRPAARTIPHNALQWKEMSASARFWLNTPLYCIHYRV